MTHAIAQEWTPWTCSKSLKGLLHEVRTHISELLQGKQGQVYIYLLHFSAPVHPNRPARHYLGSAYDLDSRILAHMTGRGARITKAAVQRGIRLTLAEVWTGTRSLEKQLKKQRNSPRFCPICNNTRLAA